MRFGRGIQGFDATTIYVQEFGNMPVYTDNLIRAGVMDKRKLNGNITTVI